jgi:hypothetical protein
LRIAALIFGLLAGLLGSGIIALGNLVTGLAAAGVFGSHADFLARYLLYAIPNLGLLGAGVALARPRIGGLLLLASAAAWVAVALVVGHGAVLFAALPFTFAGAGGLVALFAGRESSREPEMEPAPAAPRWPEAARFADPGRSRPATQRGEPTFGFAPAPTEVAQETAWQPSAEDYVDADPMFEGPLPPAETYPHEEQAESEPPPEETYGYEEVDAAEPLSQGAYPYEEDHTAAPEETPAPEAVPPEHEFDFTADFRAAREAEAAAAAYAEPEPAEPEAEAGEPEPHEPEPEPEQWGYPHATPSAPPEPAPRYAAERQATPSRRAPVSAARRGGVSPAFVDTTEEEAGSTSAAGGSVPPPDEADYQDVEPYDPEAPARRRAGGPLRGLLRLLVLGLFLIVVGGILTALYVDYQSGSHSLLLGGQDGHSSPPPSPAPDQPPVKQPAAQHTAPVGDNPIQLAPSPATALQWSAATPNSPVPVPALPGAAPGATEAAPPAATAAPPDAARPEAPPQAAATAPVAEPSLSDPFAYCAAVGTVDAPDQRFTGPPVPPAIAAALQVPAAADPSQVRWRCVDRSVLACKADHTAACDLTPTVDTMIAYCAQHPDTQDIPAPNGYWACSGTRPVIPRDQKWPVDARGFYPEAWTRVAPPAAG